MRLSFYGARPEPQLVIKLLENLPEDASVVMVKCPERTPVNAKPCQMPGGVTYEVSIDNIKFITLIQRSKTAEIEIRCS